MQQVYPIGFWQETNPILRPLMGSRPQLRSMIAWGGAEVVLTMYLGERIKRSHSWIRVLWRRPNSSPLADTLMALGWTYWGFAPG